MRFVIVAALISVLAGCGGSFEIARAAGMPASGSLGAPTARDDQRCRDLDDARGNWGLVAKGAGFLAAAAAVTAIPVTSREGEITLGITSAAFGAVAAGAVVKAEQKGSAWARECSGQ